MKNISVAALLLLIATLCLIGYITLDKNVNQDSVIALPNTDVTAPKDPVKSERSLARTIEVVSSPTPEASGIEWIDGQWYIVDDEGHVFIGDERYDLSGDIEGIAYCGDRIYIAHEGREAIEVFDHDLERLERIPIGIGKDNIGIEGIACAPEGYYISTERNSNVYHYGYNGAYIGEYDLPDSDISGLDYVDGLIYALSDKEDSITIYDVKARWVIDTWPIPQEGEWEGLKVRDGTIYIVEDDESLGA